MCVNEICYTSGNSTDFPGAISTWRVSSVVASGRRNVSDYITAAKSCDPSVGRHMMVDRNQNGEMHQQECREIRTIANNCWNSNDLVVFKNNNCSRLVCVMRLLSLVCFPLSICTKVPTVDSCQWDFLLIILNYRKNFCKPGKNYKFSRKVSFITSHFIYLIYLWKYVTFFSDKIFSYLLWLYTNCLLTIRRAFLSPF